METLELTEELQKPPLPEGSPETVVSVKARRAPEFWETDRGRKTLTYLHAWGLVVRGRIDTKDPSYVPPMDCDGVSSGTNRSAPSNVSDVLNRFLDVDRVRLKMSAGQQRVSYFCFVTSQTVRQRYRPIFSDGTFGDWQNGRDPEDDSPQIAGYENDTRTAFIWDWKDYPAIPQERQVWDDWKIDPEKFLERQLQRLGELVAKELGL